MSNVYAAYGPVPTSVGVTASPRLNGSLDRRIIVGRSATLGRTNPGAMTRAPPPHMGMGSSYQDLRRSRECLEIKHGPMEPFQPLEPLGVGDGVLHGSVDAFPTLPITTLERRRNGGLVTGGCSVHGGTLSRVGSRAGSRYQLAEEERRGGGGGGCCRKSCCTLTLSVIACLLILGGVIVALYFFIKNVPYENPPPSQEVRDPCQGKKCHHGAVCVHISDGRNARCQCPEECHRYGGGGGLGASGDLDNICGSDGKDYDSECQLRRYACSMQRHLEIRYPGKCELPRLISLVGVD